MTNIPAQLPLHRKNPTVLMSLAGDIRVIDNILKKRRLLLRKNSLHKEIRPVLILPPGAMKGSIQAGVALGLEKVDIVRTFEGVVGSSAGAAVAYYTFAGEAAVGASVIYEDMVDMKFVNPMRPWKLINIDGFEEAVRHKKPIAKEKLQKARAKIHVGATDVQTGKGQIFELNTAEDPFACVLASICIPVVSGRNVQIGEQNYVDGAITFPLPISYALKTFNPTDILLVSGSLPDEAVPFSSLTEVFLKRIFSKSISGPLRDAIIQSYTHANKDFDYITGKKKLPNGVRLLNIYPQASKVGYLTMQRNILQNAILEAMQFTQALFSDEVSVV